MGIPVSLYARPAGAYRTFGLQQYRCRCLPLPIEVAPRDYVLDGGGCWGDTALYFAEKVGEGGKVFSFEFLTEHLEIMQRNLEVNPTLGHRVEIVRRALWLESGKDMDYEARGPGTRLLGGAGTSPSPKVKTLAIDDFVAERKLARLDFIKMDIEGSELSALRGAERTLKHFVPKLAICVYHRLDDFFDIPDYLDALRLGYRFYLRHFSIHSEETVLFAARPTPSKVAAG